MAKRKQQKLQKQRQQKQQKQQQQKQQQQKQKQQQQKQQQQKQQQQKQQKHRPNKINRTERKDGLHNFPSPMPVQKSSIGLGKSCKPPFRSLDWRKQIQLYHPARLLNAYSALIDRSRLHVETDLQTSISTCYSFS